jgi:hypothetical protein
MEIDKESINIVRSIIGSHLMSGCIFGINFSREAIFELYKHEAKIMRMPRNSENQKLKVAFRKVQNLVNYLCKLNQRRIEVRKAMTRRYYYSKGICTMDVSYNDLIAKFGRVKVEVIRVHNSDSIYKVNNVSSDIWTKSSYYEKD